MSIIKNQLPSTVPTIESIWVNPPNQPRGLILKLNVDETENWLVPKLAPEIEIKDIPEIPDPIIFKLAGSNGSSSVGIAESGMVFAKDLLFSPGASWMMSFLFLAVGVTWTFYSIGRFTSKIAKEVNVAKIVSTVFQTQAKAQDLIKTLSESNIRSERKIDAALSEISAVKNDVRELYSRMQDVRNTSKETGDELSGQLHGIERDLEKVEKLINNK